MLYAVMRPHYEKTGEKYINADGSAMEWCRVSFVTVGTAESMADAKIKFPVGHFAKCYSWVLEEIREIH